MYHSIWLGGGLIFHRDSAPILEALQCALGQKKRTSTLLPLFFLHSPALLAHWFVICVCLSPAPASDDVLSAPARSECLCAILISMVSGEEREGGTEKEGERERLGIDCRKGRNSERGLSV